MLALALQSDVLAAESELRFLLPASVLDQGRDWNVRVYRSRRGCFQHKLIDDDAALRESSKSKPWRWLFKVGNMG